MKTDDLDFDLPQDLIAQTPCADRAASRLLHYRRADRQIRHLHFFDLPDLLRAGDLLVFNDTRVIPARFTLQKSTGGRIDALFLSEPQSHHWLVLLRNFGDAMPGVMLTFASDPTLTATLEETLGSGEYRLRIATSESAAAILDRLGRMPLPSYIKREKTSDARDALDRDRYQTVYASHPGAVAAPTAGLHFTPELLAQLDKRQILRAPLTLHVGPGTFRPISADSLDAHPMHAEQYHIPAPTADALNLAKKESRRIIPVGTTSARVLESQPADIPFAECSGQTSIFIYPPYRWKHTDALITNFHLPRSTLIALVAALVGLDEQRRIYKEAIAHRYRFFSYGDAMLIE
jgi:S-adenosylmethionine:tRNA ribosyltransferase-isomerase